MRVLKMHPAPGGPGKEPTWASANKCGVGSSRRGQARVWFTLHAGQISEIFAGSLDTPRVGAIDLVVSDGSRIWLEKDLEWQAEPVVPGGRLVSRGEGFTLSKTIVVDPNTGCLLVRAELKGEGVRLYALCQPTCAGRAQTLELLGRRWLCLECGDHHLVMSGALGATSVGYRGENDALTDLRRHQELRWHFDTAGPGHVVLAAELRGDLGLAFGHSRESALNNLAQAFAFGFEASEREYLRDWSEGLEARDLAPASRDRGRLYRHTLQLLEVCDDKRYRGAYPASPCIPWGQVHGQSEKGGYHLVWPRDLAQVGLARLAADQPDKALEVLTYLATTQHEDGSFPKNCWMDGRAFAEGVQLDEVAAPILLASRLHAAIDFYPMAARAARFLLLAGPRTDEERWEENGGYSPSTLASVTTALLEAAAMARERGDDRSQLLLEEQADFYEANLERWLVMDGRYVRLNPEADTLTLKNGGGTHRPAEILDMGFLQLVRYGLRAADDPLILATLRAVDAELKVDTPLGPGWYRYNHDGYGEKDEHTPFRGAGQGRLWPLLTCERALYEEAAGRSSDALIEAVERMAGPELLLSEQVWEESGTPTGSARPLLWAHALYVQLLRVRSGERHWERAAVTERYARGHRSAPSVWTLKTPQRQLPPGRWRILCEQEFRLDSGEASQTCELGVHWVDLASRPLRFKLYWVKEQRWEEGQFQIDPTAS